jgi:cell division protein FtsW (lipid II flippase)
MQRDASASPNVDEAETDAFGTLRYHKQMGKQKQTQQQKRTTTLGDIDDDIGHAVFVSWISVAATLCGAAIVGLLIKPRTGLIELASDFLLAVSICIVAWAMFVFYGFRKRHWTAWILFIILAFLIATFITLAFI